MLTKETSLTSIFGTFLADSIYPKDTSLLSGFYPKLGADTVIGGAGVCVSVGQYPQQTA